MAYASFDDVTARAGRLAGGFLVEGKHPDRADIEGFLADVAAEIDAILRAHGHDPATFTSDTREALRGLNADGALILAIPGLDPSGKPENFVGIYNPAKARYDAGMKLLNEGKLAALLELESAGTGATAGSFWTDEPTYGDVAPRAEDEVAAVAPFVSRTQTF